MQDGQADLHLCCTYNEGVDQPTHPPSLIIAFVNCFVDSIHIRNSKTLISLCSCKQVSLSLAWSHTSKVIFFFCDMAHL